MAKFNVVAPFEPRGDQPAAIEELRRRFAEGQQHQTLLGVTGSGKTFTMAHVIQAISRPTLVISHNKTLAAQLFSEFRQFFPENAVEYFVSYYDYYQPEAYLPQQDIYIQKDASINEDLDRLRLAATSSLMAREDVIIIASVSCIFGLGAPTDYEMMLVHLKPGDQIDRDEILRKLVDIQYSRNDYQLQRGCFRPRGDVVDVFPAYEGRNVAYRIVMFGDEVDEVAEIDALTGEVIRELDEMFVYPAKHFVLPEDKLSSALEAIEQELEARLAELRSKGKLIEAQRLEARARYDLEMLAETGYCQGVENYSRHLSGRAPGEPPYTLLDYFPDDFLTIVDESHATIPQIRAMYLGDQSRKITLVEHGFRLPSALDNRPLRFEEWERKAEPVLFVSATPSQYELKTCRGEVVEQIIRPTGLIDPEIAVRPARGQVDDLLIEIAKRADRGERVLVTTLTKRMAEDLSEFIQEEGLRGHYLHSEMDAFERVDVLRDLRLGRFDVVVGVNLLREGLDLPEVSLVAILDADKEGFLRNETSLIQTIGRTARNVNAQVILYGDEVTGSMRRAMEETERRRQIQLEYNQEHGISPTTVQKEIRSSINAEVTSRQVARDVVREGEVEYVTRELLGELEAEMQQAAADLDFERAAELRDRIAAIKEAQDRSAEAK